MEQGRKVVHVYTDGACEGNPGPGGWGFYIAGKEEVKRFGGEKRTTNNRMEMLAVIKALEFVQPGDHTDTTYTVYSDSEYVVKGITQWINGWKRYGWMTKSKTPVKNDDLWKQMDVLKTPNVNFQHVAGHQGIPGNEEADALAKQGVQLYNASSGEEPPHY